VQPLFAAWSRKTWVWLQAECITGALSLPSIQSPDYVINICIHGQVSMHHGRYISYSSLCSLWTVSMMSASPTRKPIQTSTSIYLIGLSKNILLSPDQFSLDGQSSSRNETIAALPNTMSLHELRNHIVN